MPAVERDLDLPLEADAALGGRGGGRRRGGSSGVCTRTRTTTSSSGGGRRRKRRAGQAAQPRLPVGQRRPQAGDIAALSRKLATLITGIAKVAAGDADLQHRLAVLAAAATTAVKSGDAAAADAAIGALGHAMAEAMHRPAAAPAASNDPPPDLLALFRDAKEDVDQGFNKLQAAMRGTEDEDMIRIAELGMYGMTDGAGVGLMKALMELRGASPDRRAALGKAARDAAVAYKAAVLGHVLVDLVDANPFGITVGLQTRLVSALDTIAATA